MTTFRDLIGEVERGEARRLVDKPVGPYGIRFAIVQRADGSIWQASDIADELGSQADAWSVPTMERVYLSWSRMMPWGPDDLDAEALFRHISWQHAQDDTAAALEAAEWIVSQR